MLARSGILIPLTLLFPFAVHASPAPLHGATTIIRPDTTTPATIIRPPTATPATPVPYDQALRNVCLSDSCVFQFNGPLSCKQGNVWVTSEKAKLTKGESVEILCYCDGHCDVYQY